MNAPVHEDHQVEIVAGSGNVFADVGMPDPDAALAKAKFAYAISSQIRRRRWTQAEAARILGVGQPDVSRIVRGRLEGYSIERLALLLNRLDLDVDISVSPNLELARPARTRVIVPD